MLIHISTIRECPGLTQRMKKRKRAAREPDQNSSDEEAVNEILEQWGSEEDQVCAYQVDLILTDYSRTMMGTMTPRVRITRKMRRIIHNPHAHGALTPTTTNISAATIVMFV